MKFRTRFFVGFKRPSSNIHDFVWTIFDCLYILKACDDAKFCKSSRNNSQNLINEASGKTLKSEKMTTSNLINPLQNAS